MDRVSKGGNAAGLYWIIDRGQICKLLAGNDRRWQDGGGRVSVGRSRCMAGPRARAVGRSVPDVPRASAKSVQMTNHRPVAVSGPHGGGGGGGGGGGLVGSAPSRRRRMHAASSASLAAVVDLSSQCPRVNLGHLPPGNLLPPDLFVTVS